MSRKRGPKISISDGGVEADVTCSCGEIFHISIWGVVFKRNKRGKILGQQEGVKNRKECKCGRRYSFICIPDIGYLELTEA